MIRKQSENQFDESIKGKQLGELRTLRNILIFFAVQVTILQVDDWFITIKAALASDDVATCDGTVFQGSFQFLNAVLWLLTRYMGTMSS